MGGTPADEIGGAVNTTERGVSIRLLVLSEEVMPGTMVNKIFCAVCLTACDLYSSYPVH